MNLADAMLNKLYEASKKVERDQSLMPQGLNPMNTQQGAEVLSHMRRVNHNSFPKLSLRPMSSSLGQSILDKLNNKQ